MPCTTVQLLEHSLGPLRWVELESTRTRCPQEESTCPRYCVALEEHCAFFTTSNSQRQRQRIPLLTFFPPFLSLSINPSLRLVRCRRESTSSQRESLQDTNTKAISPLYCVSFFCALFAGPAYRSSNFPSHSTCISSIRSRLGVAPLCSGPLLPDRMDVDDDGHPSWLKPVSQGLPSMNHSPGMSQERPNSSMTPQSAQLGPPNTITPWTGKPQRLSRGDSSAVKESQMRRRHHKQKAKLSFFHSESQDYDESSPNHDSANSFEASSPARATHKGKDTMSSFHALSQPSQRGRGVPMFSSQLRALEADAHDEDPDTDDVPRERIIDTLFQEDDDEPLLFAEPSEAEHHSQGSHHSGEGVHTMDSPKKKGILPMSSFDPSGRVVLDTSPRPKLSEIMKGLAPGINSPASQRKKPTSRKPTNKSNMKMKMLALESEGDRTKDDATASDPFDSGNIPPSLGSSPAATKPVARISGKRRAAARQPKAANKQATSRQRKVKQTLVDSNTHNPDVGDSHQLGGAGQMDDGNDNDESYIDKKPRTRATRGNVRARKAKESLTSKSDISRNMDSRSGSNLNKKKTSRTKADAKSKALPSKAVETSTTESSAATVNTGGSIPRPRNMALRTFAVSKQAQHEVSQNTHSPQQNRSSEVSDMLKSPATTAQHVVQADKAHQLEKTALIDPTEIQEKVRPSVKEARKVTIISFGANGPQNTGKPRKSSKSAHDPAGDRALDPQLERGTETAETIKPKLASYQNHVEHDCQKQELEQILSKPAEAVKNPPTYSPQAQCPEEDGLDQQVGCDSVADIMRSLNQPQSGAEEENEVLPHDILDGHAEYDDDFTAVVNRHVPGNEDPAGSHGECTAIALRGGQTTTNLFSDSGKSDQNGCAVNGYEEKRPHKIRSPIEQAPGVQTTHYQASDGSNGRSTGKRLTVTQRYPPSFNVPSGQAELAERVERPRTHIHTGDRESLKRPAPANESDQPARPFKQRLRFPSYSQVPWVGFGATFCVPENGHSSDDVFGPGRSEHHPSKHISPEPHEIDPAVIERLRGGTTAHLKATRDTAVPLDLFQQRAGAQAGSYPARVTSTNPSAEGADEILPGINGTRQERSEAKDQGPLKEDERGLEQAGMPIELEGMAGTMHRIVNVSVSCKPHHISVVLMLQQGVLRKLESKEAAIHHVIEDYVSGSNNLVRSISGQQQQEKELAREEHQKRGTRYTQVCQDVRCRVGSLANELQAVDISKVASHAEGARTLNRLRHLRLALSGM